MTDHISDQAPGTPSGLGPSVDLTNSPRALGKLDTSGTHDYFAPQARTSLVKSVLAPVFSLLPGAVRGGGRKRQHDEGIIAPRTPLRGSPMPSPRLSAVNLSLPGPPTGPTSYTPWASDDSASASGYGTPLGHVADLRSASPRHGSLGLSAPSSGSINQRRASPKPSLANLAAGSPVNNFKVPSSFALPAASPSRPPPKRTASVTTGMKRTASSSGVDPTVSNVDASVNEQQPPLGVASGAENGSANGVSIRRAAARGKDD